MSRIDLAAEYELTLPRPQIYEQPRQLPRNLPEVRSASLRTTSHVTLTQVVRCKDGNFDKMSSPDRLTALKHLALTYITGPYGDIKTSSA